MAAVTTTAVAADYTAVVQQIYLSYFGRPADTLGLANYTAQLAAMNAPLTMSGILTAVKTNAGLATLVNSFGTSAESVALYGTDTIAFVSAIYVNVLNRTADFDGLLYWAGEINAGRLTKAAAALNIAQGALDNTTAAGLLDAATLTAKTQVAINFTHSIDTGAELSAYTGTAAAAAARDLLKTVTSSTVAADFQTRIDTTLAALVVANTPVVTPVNLTLTTGVDAFTGTTANDTFNAAVNVNVTGGTTLSTADNLNGGDGTDTLYIALTTAFSPAAGRITNIENIVLQSPIAGGTFDLSGTTGVTTIDLQTPAGAFTVTGLASAAVASKVANTAALTTFTYKANGLTSTTDDLKLTVSGVTGAITVNNDTSSLNSFETATITSNGIASVLATGTTLSGSTVTSIVVNGDANLSFADAQNAVVNKVNASAFTGNLSMSLASATGGVSVTGGTGNDSLTGGAHNDTIASGAGDDTITTGAGFDSIDAGAGNDTVVASSVTSDDVIAGGAGVDTLNVTTALTYNSTVDHSKNISGFELLGATTAVTQDMTGLNAKNTITGFNAGGTGTVVLQNVVGGATGFATASTGTQTTAGLTLGLKTNGTADALAVSVGSATGSGTASVGFALAATQIESLSIASTGAVGATNTVTLGLSNAGDGVTAATASTVSELTTLTITGNRSTTISGTGQDALKTVNAAGFTGAAGTTLTVTSASKVATTVSANGAYNVSVTTGTAADTITTGSGDDTVSASDGANTITAGEGNNSVTSTSGADIITTGAGNDTISAGDGANVIVAGDGANSVTTTAGLDKITTGTGNDTISAGAGNNIIIAGDGNNSVTTTSGNDSVTAGFGNDTIDVGAGNDTVVSAAGNDTITAGTGNDSIDSGDGDDSITGGTGDDTIVSGAGNDTITISSLTNGDSIDGGAGTADSLTITSITADATPASITGIELFSIGSIGSASTAQTIDFTKVSGMTTLATVNATSNATETLKNLPTTITTINVQDSGAGSDTLAVSFVQTPSGTTTFNADTVSNTATNFTSVGALTLNGRLTTDYLGTARIYTSAMASSLGTVNTDSSALSIKVDALTAAVTGAELTVGNITANSATSVAIASSAFSDVTVGTLTASSAELASISLTAAANSTLAAGNITAAGATNLAYGITIGDSGALNTITTATFAAADVTVTGAVGNDVLLAGFTGQAITAKTYASNTWTIGAATGNAAAVVLPSIAVNATTGTIGATTITAGSASKVEQSIGITTTAASIGAITVNGSGNVKLTLGATTAATTGSGTSTVRAQGAIDASAMTSSVSVLNLVGTNAVSSLLVTGGSGNDTIIGGTITDTLTGGIGADSVTGNGGIDTFVFSAGHATGVNATGIAGTSTGTDIISDFTIGTDLIRINVTSADTTWDISTHVVVGTGTTGGTIYAANSATEGVVTSFQTSNILVQAGNPATNTDGYDYIITASGTTPTAGQAVAATVVNLTGTLGNDTLTTGVNADTISGGAGNDTITGAAGADSMTGGAGNDVFVANQTSSVATSTSNVTLGASATLVDNLDTFTFATGIVLREGTGVDVITDFAAGDTIDVTTAGTDYINLNGTTAATNLVANSHYYLQGTYVASTGVFTVNSAATSSDTGFALLIVADATAATLAAQTSVIILTGVAAATLTSATFV
jgi:Ca2+-binding RTX toxin-like protein